MSEVTFADRARTEYLCDSAGRPAWAAASRLGCLRVASPARSIWLQMRGSCRVDSREGSLLLQRGDWIAFARESSPELRSGFGSLTVGLVLSADLQESALAFRDQIPLVGRGRMRKQSLYLAMHLWREAALRSPSTMATRTFLQNVSYSQGELFLQLGLCSGRSFRKKRERFEMLQRLMLHLDGNSHRIVRLAELAAMAGCSVWHLSKSIRDVYGLNPSSIAQRYRLSRARHLLASTSLAISEVSGASGFESPAAFARAFRSGNGMSASQYRLAARLSGHRVSPIYDAQVALDARSSSI